jgi:hypothetical protein
MTMTINVVIFVLKETGEIIIVEKLIGLKVNIILFSFVDLFIFIYRSPHHQHQLI